VAAGCGGGADDPLVTDEPTTVEQPEQPDATGPDDGTAGEAVGEVAAVLAFSAPTLAGGTLEGAELAGRPVVFWFWSPH
jgi:hypothetical protein